MNERHCILILAHNARVPAARHTRLTRSTGPTSVPAFRYSLQTVRHEMRATHVARVLSQLAHRAQLANLHMRICACRHSSITSTSEMELRIWKHERGKRRLQAGTQSNVGGKQSPLATFKFYAAALLYPPFPTRARLSSLRARDGYSRSTGSKVACGRAVASERQVGLSVRSGLAHEVRDGCNSLAVELEEGQLEAPGTRRSP